MELAAKSEPKAEYRVAEPIFFNDHVIGVLDGKYVLGTLSRETVSTFRTEHRTSFKHPVAGLLMGFAMVGVPLLAVVGDPLGMR